MDASAQGTAGFSPDETAQLQELFGLDETALEILLGGCAFVLEQAAYATTPPETLRAELVDAGVGEEHAHAFSAVWEEGAAECIAALKENAVLAPRQLTTIDWQLGVSTASGQGSRAQAVHSVLQLELSKPSADGNAAATVAVHMRVDADGMSALLSKLDTIQGQMDRLG